MKVFIPVASFLLIAGAAPLPVLAQTAPSGSSVTRDLNSGPPTAAATPRATTTPPVSTPPRAAANTAASPSSTTPSNRPAAASTPRPTSTPPAATTRPAPAATPALTAPAVTTTTAVPAAAPNPPPAPPNVPTATVLNASARAALPFTVDLPSGFEIVTGRPGPDFKIYTIRRAGKSFAMIYAGPSSQFPIYSGEQVQAGGRTSLVKVEDGQRHAMEHLFQRPETAGAPREVHVWTMSLDGADRALAERIAQSVDVR